MQAKISRSKQEIRGGGSSPPPHGAEEGWCCSIKFEDAFSTQQEQSTRIERIRPTPCGLSPVTPVNDEAADFKQILIVDDGRPAQQCRSAQHLPVQVSPGHSNHRCIPLRRILNQDRGWP